MPVEIPKDKWPGSIKAITIGATAAEGGTRDRSITLGGQTTMPYLQFEAPTPNKPVIAIELKSRPPEDWSPLLVEAWGDAMEDPAQWAKKAEETGADVLVLTLTVEDFCRRCSESRQICADSQRTSTDCLGTRAGRER